MHRQPAHRLAWHTLHRLYCTQASDPGASEVGRDLPEWQDAPTRTYFASTPRHRSLKESAAMEEGTAPGILKSWDYNFGPDELLSRATRLIEECTVIYDKIGSLKEDEVNFDSVLGVRLTLLIFHSVSTFCVFLPTGLLLMTSCSVKWRPCTGSTAAQIARVESLPFFMCNGDRLPNFCYFRSLRRPSGFLPTRAAIWKCLCTSRRSRNYEMPARKRRVS